MIFSCCKRRQLYYTTIVILWLYVDRSIDVCEEEKMSLVQTAVNAGETTPPTAQKYMKDSLPAEQEKLMSSSADTKILDRLVKLSLTF